MITDFLQTFMSIMGDHFMKLGAEQKKASEGTDTAAPMMTAVSTTKTTTKSTTTKSTALQPSGIVGMGDSGPATREIVTAARTPTATPAMDDDVREVLANPVLVEILRDPMMQRVLEECRMDGSRLRHYLGIPEVKKRLVILQKAGLIRIDM